MTIVPSSPVSSASGLVAAGQHPRGDAPRKTAEPFVLPPDDRPPPRPHAERRQAETQESPPSPCRPAKADASNPEAPCDTDASTDQAAEPASGTKISREAGPVSLVGLQEEGLVSAASEIAGNADSTASGHAAADAVLLDVSQQVQADMADNTAQQVQVQISAPIPAIAIADAAGEQLATEAVIAMEAAATAIPSKAAQDGQTSQQKPAEPGAPGAGALAVATDGGASKTTGTAIDIAIAIPGSDTSAMGEAQVLNAGKPGMAASKTAVTSGEKSVQPASGEVLPGTAPTEAKNGSDPKADQAAASAGAAKSELVTRLEQSFAQPLARPAEIAPAPLPPQSAPAELPKAIPPSAVPIEIGLRSLQGLKEFQIRLDPAELGRIDVKLEIGDDKSVTARVVVDRVETLHLLQREAKTLERAFEQAGLKSSDASVDIILRDPGQQADQGRRDGRFDEYETGGRDGRAGKPALVDIPVIPIRRTLHVGALDLSI